MLWMLSLGYLLDVSNEEFKKLVEVIDQDKVKDKLYEFIISAKLEDRKFIEEESYRDVFYIRDIFSKLRDATQVHDQMEAASLIKGFLNKDWYKGHKDAGWYNSHQSRYDTYSGYWCFEAAAVTCIMGLDDSSYRDQQYYPKDLVHYYRANH
ncbi:PoNe immunity protein domain-containing protein [Marinoscillum luteum]|uniref:PoNe immunity protein domain-containing protein n=1 Tax=Marinoscillum luteum TaxID=861051 RepID=A0ABW7NCE7_9BACT